MVEARPYRMRVRAERTAATRARVLEAVVGLGREDLDLDPTLDRVAARADVSVQTVLRHFGTREALLDAALETAQRSVVQERLPTAGGADAAIAVLLAHYDRWGAFSLAVLARERDDPRAAAITTGGRRLHREWVDEAFAARLPTTEPGDRDALVDLLVVATDVFTWKLLHIDRGLPVDVVHLRMRTLTDAILARH
jgi:AcrR family transcriptional regulator